MSVYLDTSVLVSMFCDDAHTERARSLLLGAANPAVSDFGALEFASVISRLQRERALTDPEAEATRTGFDTWRDQAAEWLEATPADLRAATAFVAQAELGLRGPDAIHIALASRIGAPLATFDLRLGKAAAALGLAVATA